MVPASRSAPRSAVSSFALTSPDVREGQTIAYAQLFNGMGCTGQNVSPQLDWKGAPAGTQGYAITLHDPDAPTGSGWWHWVVYNIPADVARLVTGAGNPERNLMPPGAVQGNTDFGKQGYGGPCPPEGDKPHRYIFTVHALDVGRLDIPAEATAAFVGFNVYAHRLGSASLTGMYGR